MTRLLVLVAALFLISVAPVFATFPTTFHAEPDPHDPNRVVLYLPYIRHDSTLTKYSSGRPAETIPLDTASLPPDPNIFDLAHVLIVGDVPGINGACYTYTTSGLEVGSQTICVGPAVMPTATRQTNGAAQESTQAAPRHRERKD